MRLLVLAAVAVGEITHDEATCILRDTKLAVFGDSLSRFCMFGLNTFLATGALRDHPFDVSGGDGEGSDDYDGRREWNENGIISGKKSHRMHLWKDFADHGIRTDYYFIQHAYLSGVFLIPTSRAHGYR